MTIATPVRATETQRLAAFALDLSLDAVPTAVVALAKAHLLDGLGVGLAGSRHEFAAVTMAGVRMLGQGDEAAVIGSDVRLPAPSAALLNGVLIHGLDFDDTHIGAIYHATAHVAAAVLAAGETNDSTGEEMLLALIAGLEIGCRLALVGAGDFTARSFHPTAICGTFAAAAAAGRLYGLDAGTLTQALGLCGSMASGILETGSSWLKRLHPGWSAHSGTTAVILAKAGFVGPETTLEGARGFFQTHLGHVPTPDHLPSQGLGERWEALGIALKPYPCCHVLHAFVDAALDLRTRVDLDEVERIDCLLVRDWHRLVAEPREECIRPKSPYRALFSVQYVTALALVEGRVDLAAFYNEPLDKPAVLELAARCHCLDDPDSDYPAHFPGEVVLHMKDGRVVRKRRPFSLGTPEQPLTAQQLEAKFTANAVPVIGTDRAQEVVARVRRLEAVPSARDLRRLLSAAAG